jgi:acyl transferase domain-containing protein
MPELIAIIGSSCRLSGGSSSLSKLWDLLQDPRNLRTEIPLSRFNTDTFYHENGDYHGVCYHDLGFSPSP